MVGLVALTSRDTATFWVLFAGGTPLAVGLIVAAISGYASIAWLLKFLRTRSTMPWAIGKPTAWQARVTS